MGSVKATTILKFSDWSNVDRLIEKGLMVKKTFQGKTFYVGKLVAPRNNEMLGLRME